MLGHRGKPFLNPTLAWLVGFVFIGIFQFTDIFVCVLIQSPHSPTSILRMPQFFLKCFQVLSDCLWEYPSIVTYLLFPTLLQEKKGWKNYEVSNKRKEEEMTLYRLMFIYAMWQKWKPYFLFKIQAGHLCFFRSQFFGSALLVHNCMTLRKFTLDSFPLW